MQMSTTGANRHSGRRQALRVFLVLFMICAAGFSTYLTGGTGTAMTHLMYIPIIVSALYFGVAGAAAAAVLGGLVLGPLMPQSVSLGLTQAPGSWIFRMIIFSVIGILTAVLFRSVRTYREREIQISHTNMLTGLPNAGKMKVDIQEWIDKREEFCLLGFRILNLDDIYRDTDYETGIEAIHKAVEILSGCTGSAVYSIFTYEFATVLRSSSVENARQIGTRFLKQICEPLTIGRFRLELIAKGGIVNYPRQAESSDDLLRKMGIALSQKADEIGLFVYDAATERALTERSEIIVALFSAIKDGEFSLAYQPKIRLDGKSVSGVEALLRWDYAAEKKIHIDQVIQIAEETGVISEITKWAIREAIAQRKRWQDEGISVKIALNFSPKDLRDDSVVDYLIQSMEENGVGPADIEIELTERGILEDEKKTLRVLNHLRKKGIAISLDDFGTGYNSLLDLVKIPINSLKIDKQFVDRIADNANRKIIESIIKYSHNTGLQVIAEGVETGEQFELLKAMDCDLIQGYYFAKPLPPAELKRFVLDR